MINSFLFVIITFVVTRNLPFSTLAPIANFCVLCLVIIGFLHWFKKRDKYIGLAFLLITFLASYSLFFLENDPLLIMRFYIILLSLLCVHFIPFNSLKSLNIVIGLHILQGIVIMAISLYLYSTWEVSSYLPIRHWFLNNGFGDVYTYGNGFFRVQIKGNALIPFFAMVSNFLYLKTQQKKYRFSEAFLLLATLFAGNFMYLIGCGFYYICAFLMQTNYLSKVRGLKNITLLFASILIVPIAVTSAVNVIEKKSTGQVSSIGTRIDQAEVLLSDMSDDVFTVLAGKGLGNTLDVTTSARDYTGNIYFELQGVYFLNQLGFIFLALYILALFYLYSKFIYFNHLGLIYLSYVGYAISNPYILDTNHIIVIITLCLLSRLIRANMLVTGKFSRNVY